MPTLKKPIPLLINGLDTSKPSEFLDPRGTPDCQNVELRQQVIKKRPGTVAMGSTMSERIMNYAELKIGETVYLVRVGLKKIQLYNANSDTWSDVGHANFTGTQFDKFSFAQTVLAGSKILVITNGIDAIRKYTGSGNTADLGGTPPLAKYCLDYNGYVVLANITDGGNDFTSRVQWPDLGDCENWSTGDAGASDLLQDSGDITGLGRWGDAFTVHKEGSITLGSLVQTSEIFRFDRTSAGLGAVSARTIRNLPSGEQIYLSRDGIHIFNGISSPVVDSLIIEELREIMNPQYLYKSYGVVVREKDEYWCAIAVEDQTEPGTIYKYNYKTGQVYRDYRSELCAMDVFTESLAITWDDETGTWDASADTWDTLENTANNPIVIFGDCNGNSSKIDTDVYVDVATAIDSYWASKDYVAQDFGISEFGTQMRWQEIHLWALGDSVTVSYSTDEGVTYTAISTFTLTTAYPNPSSPLIGYFDAISQNIRFKFSNSTASSKFTLKKFMIKAVPREVQR